MADQQQQPSQVLPSWLSLSTFRTVDANGAPTTEATIVYLPLTYFGPSIPLGTNGVWVFGGSTRPDDTSTTTSTTIPTTTPIITTHPMTASTTHHPSSSTTRSSSRFGPTPTPTPTPSSSSILISFPTLSSSSPSPSTVLGSTSSMTLSISESSTLPMQSPQPTAAVRNRGLNARAIIAISILSSFLVILLTFLAFLWYRRRNRSRHSPRGLYSTASWSGFEVVDAEAGAAGDQDRSHPGMGERESDPLVSSAAQEQSEAAPPYVAPPRLVTVAQASTSGGDDAGPPSAGTSRNSSAPVGVALAQEADSKSIPSSTTSAVGADEGPTGASASTSSLFFRSPNGAAVVPRSSFSLPTFALSPAPRSTRHIIGTSTEAPLQPPPVLNTNRLSSTEPASNLQSSLSSSRSTMPSIAYPDSPVSDVDESVALMTARRVRVESSPDSVRGIGSSLARLGRLSWFNRRSPEAPSERSRHAHRHSIGGVASTELGFVDNPEERQPRMTQRNSHLISQTHRSDVSGSSGQSVYYDAPSRPRSPEPHSALFPYQSRHDVLDIPAPPSAMTSISSGSPRPDHLSFPPGLPLPWRNSLTRSIDRWGSSGSSSEERHLDDAPPRVGERWDRLRGQIADGGSVGSFGGASVRQGYAITRYSTQSERASLHSMRSHIHGSPHGAGSRASSQRSGPSSSSSRGAASLLNHSNSVSSDGRKRLRNRNEVGPMNRVSMHAVGRRGGSDDASESRLSSQALATSITGETTVSDPSSGAIMHFPTNVWQAHQGEQQWPEDAWAEFPDKSR